MKVKISGNSEKIYINEIIRINYKCNWKCKFCNVIKTNNYWEKDISSKEVILKILNLVKKYPSKEQRSHMILSFSWWEPTLNPDLPKFVRLAKKLWVGVVEIQTNGSILFVKKNLIFDLIDAWLNEIFLAQHSHLDEVNKKLWAIYRVQDFERWIKFIRDNDIHNKINIYLNIVVWQININYLLDYVQYLDSKGFLDFITPTTWITDKGERNFRKISLWLTQPNWYAELNADQVVLQFNEEQNSIIEKFISWCDVHGYYPDFHFTSPPLCVLNYPEFNLEHNRLKKLEEHTSNGEVNAWNLESYKFLWREKKKLSICSKCPNDKYCLWFYKNWINFVWEDYALLKASKYISNSV